MTHEEISRWAHEAGFNPVSYQGGNAALFERFAASVAAAEREACARLIEDYERFGDTRDCAAAIRARGQE